LFVLISGVIAVFYNIINKNQKISLLYMSEPTIIIDPNEELQIVLRIIYYNVPGFYSNPRKIRKICIKEGYTHFRLKDITNWLENQYDYQIYRHPPKIKAQASFSKCRIPNKLHQCDLLPH
ncbi:13299_t:CDS:1, partial [Racocetra fulgida]